MNTPAQKVLTPVNSFLLRALWEWLTSNGETPHAMVNAEYPGVVVPRDCVRNGMITFNLSDTATRHLQMGDEAITFNARFGGKDMRVHLPIGSVVQMYGKESLSGMALPALPPSEASRKDDAPTQVVSQAEVRKKVRAHLSLVSKD